MLVIVSVIEIVVVRMMIMVIILGMVVAMVNLAGRHLHATD